MMVALLEKTMLVVQPLGLAIMTIYAYGLFRRSINDLWILNLIMGALFGLEASFAMLSPMPLADGIIVDIRNLFIGIAGAFFGFVGAGIALGLGIATRLAIGGEGATIGVYGMLVSGSMGVIWAHFIRPRIAQNILAYGVLGTMISGHILVGFLLPSAVWANFFIGLGPTLLIANIVGAVLLSFLIEREQRLIDIARDFESQATIDPLTKLVNRNTAVAAFANLPAPRTRCSGQTMICIDVDRFKSINDEHGHIRGDQVLVDVAARLSSCVRPDDILSRISGDEFLIVLHDVKQDHARDIAERCLTAVNEKPITTDNVAIDVSISIGAVWSDGRPNFTAFREIADQALYKAKALGRNCVSFEVTPVLAKPQQTQVA
ncbi:diguanylate cyclase domain-containing protein [Yoonia sp. BS5-3]|uniref:diguanylate cyclase n=1 Tax=Yoonia phaeophyticola TaxID=3137369 RepID=A0ABZ2V6Q7_9RHOB